MTAFLSDAKRAVAQDILDRATKNFRVEYSPEMMEFCGSNAANGDVYYGSTAAAVGQQLADWTERWITTIRRLGDEGVNMLVDECRAAAKPDNVHPEALGVGNA